MEAIEGVMIEELEGKIGKILLCDNSAAVRLATQRMGSWRTRRLKVKAAHLRWRSENGGWDMVHKKGKELVAGVGTKVMGPLRVNELNQMMNWPGAAHC